jgi:RecJ-like exonuclease
MTKNKDKSNDNSTKRSTRIIVNGRKVESEEKKLSYRDVVLLGFSDAEFAPQIVYTVTYKRGKNQKPKGVMVEGDVVTIKKDMVFNVTRTDKS